MVHHNNPEINDEVVINKSEKLDEEELLSITKPNKDSFRIDFQFLRIKISEENSLQIDYFFMGSPLSKYSV